MNKVSRPAVVKAKVSFEVTVPGILKEDIPGLNEHNIINLDGCIECRSYAYKFESSPKKLSAQRFSDVDSSFQYIMFVLYKAAEFHVKDVHIYYDEETGSMSFDMDFGTECENEAERFHAYLFLNCGN